LNAVRRRWLAAGALLAFAAPALAADTLPELVRRTKPSVVLVGSYGMLDAPRFGFRGTGFAVGDGLHVLTNAHVLPTIEPGGPQRSVAVQVWSAELQWQLRSARVVGKDPQRDLALLRIDGPALPALPLSKSEVAEGSAIVLMGFPLGGALGYSHVTHRGIVSARTAIVPPATGAQGLSARAVQQLRQGSFEVLQLDATAYPGNSGGPVIDPQTGEVVGVVSMVLVKNTREAALSAPSGITYAVPAGDASRMLNRAIAEP
jgi:S1-C subfamily serine protease